MSRNFRISALYICSTIVWCSVCAVSALAQTIIQTPQQADSLRRVIASNVHDTTKINAMNELAEYFRRSESKYDSAMVLAQDAHKKAKAINHSIGIAFALRNIGAIYYNIGRYGVSLEYLLQSARISDEIGDKYGVGLSFNYIANDLAEQKKENEALTYYLRSLQTFEEIQNKRGIGIVLGNIGEVLTEQGKLQEAMLYNFKALQISQEEGNQISIGYTFSRIGKVYSLQGNYNKAIEYHLKGLATQETINNRYGIIFQLNHLAETLQKQGKYQSSMPHLLRALTIADSIGYALEKKRSLFLLSQGYDILGEYRQSLAYHRQYTRLQDSLISLETLNKTTQLKESYEAEKREQQIALQQSELERRNVIQWSLVGTLGVVAIAAVLLGGLYRQKLRANKKILKQQQTLEEQAHTIEEANRELNAANTELQTTNQELDAANRMKTQLLSMAAHDLKNPLGVIIGYADIALMDLPEEAPTSSLLRTMQATADRMNKLIKDLLDSAAMEMGNISLERSEVMLPSLVHAVASRYSYNAEKKEQHIVVEANDHFTVSADADRIEQVLDNLISNAVKYSPTGKTIWVRAMQRGGVARVEVQDEGPGMSDADRAKLFGFFQRLSAQPTGGESSNGVGLAIVKKIVDLHKGKIWAESELGKGTTFVVELPLAGIASERCEE